MKQRLELYVITTMTVRAVRSRSSMLHPDQNLTIICAGSLKKDTCATHVSWLASWSARSTDRRCILRVVRTVSRLPSAAENYTNLRMEGLTRLQEHRLELQHRLDMHRTQMEMPPSPSPSSRSLAPFSSASSSLSEGSNQPSGEDSASIVTGILILFSFYPLRFLPLFHDEENLLLDDSQAAEINTNTRRYSGHSPRGNQLSPKVRGSGQVYCAKVCRA